MAALVAGAALAWRLARGPIDVAFLVPRLERALASRDGATTVRIGGVDLHWDRQHHQVRVRARDVRVVGASGEPLVNLPFVAVDLVAGALVRGAVVPRAIEVVAPRLTFRRTTDGGVHVSVGGREGEGPAVLERLVRAPQWPALRRIEVREGEIEIADRPADRPARLHAVDAALVRDADGLALTLSGTAEVGAATMPLHLAGVYRVADATVEARVQFDAVDPAAVVGELPEDMAAPARHVAVPLSGTLALVLDDALRPRRVRLEASGADGRLMVPGVPGGEVPVEQLRVAADLDLPSRTLAVDEVTIRLPRGSVRGHGRATRFGEDVGFIGQLTAADVPVDALSSHWPISLAPGTRGWVTSRVTAGVVREAQLRVRGRVASAGSVAVTGVRGSLAYAGLAVRYLDRMPPARDVGGTAKFSREEWRFHVERGAVGQLALARARIDIGAAGNRRRASIDASVRGPLAEGLAVARTAPVVVPATLPADVSGTMDARLQMDVPLDGPAVPQNVRLSADLRDVAARALFRGQSLAGGRFALALRDGAVDLTGEGTVAGAPITVAWNERLERRGGSSRRVRITSRLDPAACAALGVELRPWIDGPIDVTADARVDGGKETVDLGVDLKSATIALGAVTKPAGGAADATAHVELAGGVVTAVRAFSFTGAGAQVTARGSRTADGSAWDTVDLAGTIAVPDPTRPPAHVGLTLRQAPSGYAVVLTSDDAGVLFRALGGGADARGGRLRYAGTATPAAAGAVVDGHLELTDFTLLRAPILARVATLASVSGLASAFDGGGMKIVSLNADVRHAGSVFTVADGVASASSVAVLAAGTVDHASRALAFKGTLVPSYYGINAGAARLPGIEKLVTGGKGEGLQAFDFRVSGTIDAPNVSVDPLAALAPGIMRDVVRKLPGFTRP